MKRKICSAIALFLFILSFSMICSAAVTDDIHSKLSEIKFVGGDEYDPVYVCVKDALVKDGIVYKYHEETDSFTACNFYKDAAGGDVKFASMIYGKKVTAVSADMFDYDIYMVGCKSVVFPNTLTDSMTLTGSRIESIRYSDNMKLPGEVRGDTSLKSVTLPQKAVKSGSFINCSNLRKVVMGSKVKTVESFKGCKSLASLQLPSSVKTIEAEAFKGCTSLELYVPSSVKKIGKDAFGTKKSNRIKMLYCVKNSAAYKEAKKNSIPYTLVKTGEKKAKLTGISVSDTKLTLLKDEEVYLNARPVPVNAADQELVYKSSDPGAVSVDQYGRITALKYNSSAVITVQSAADKAIKKKVTVKVKKKKSESFSLIINGKKYAADLNSEEVRGNNPPRRLEKVEKFRIYEASRLKRNNSYVDPYCQTSWKMIKETAKNKFSVRTKTKKYYRIEYKLRGNKSWYILYTMDKV